MTVNCPYCEQPAKLVTGRDIYPHRSDLREKRFWQCAPCKAHVGTHANSKRHAPYGTLANAELRKTRSALHAAFDPLWRGGRFKTRKAAYSWLAEQLGVQLKACHIGMFDLDMCGRALEVLKSTTATPQEQP